MGREILSVRHSNLMYTIGGGSPVPSTTEASLGAVAYNFSDPLVTSGVIFVTFRSPSGTGGTAIYRRGKLSSVRLSDSCG